MASPKVGEVLESIVSEGIFSELQRLKVSETPLNRKVRFFLLSEQRVGSRSSDKRNRSSSPSTESSAKKAPRLSGTSTPRSSNLSRASTSSNPSRGTPPGRSPARPGPESPSSMPLRPLKRPQSTTALPSSSKTGGRRYFAPPDSVFPSQDSFSGPFPSPKKEEEPSSLQPPPPIVRPWSTSALAGTRQGDKILVMAPSWAVLPRFDGEVMIQSNEQLQEALRAGRQVTLNPGDPSETAPTITVQPASPIPCRTQHFEWTAPSKAQSLDGVISSNLGQSTI
ncbi:hypothetical protein M231_06995 [Tremella mesenterica]|uniref:Uncharacterized protein n=1 Tax=Tremella mesenterica TaxID=5217 RepID=A0A4Q1BD58_TREME|nr:hypothetical protein M231_06995 [Tremella mesenterica]